MIRVILSASFIGILTAPTMTWAQPQSKASGWGALPDAELAERLQASFSTMDKDQNGFVEVFEAPNATRTRKVNDGPTEVVASGSGTWIEQFDRNNDGRVALKEFQQRMVVILRRESQPALAAGPT